MDVDNRFNTDLEYVLAGQYRVESKEIRDDANSFIFRQRPHSQLTASQARNQTVVNESIRKDKAYCFMKNLHGSPPYYQCTFNELLAMVRQLGTPTWFLTLTAADLKWPDLIGIIAKQHGVIIQMMRLINSLFKISPIGLGVTQLWLLGTLSIDSTSFGINF